MSDAINKLVKARWILVVAGNMQEFLKYCKAQNLPIHGGGRKARYIDSPERVFGTRYMPYVVVGTARMNANYDKIIEQMLVFDHFEVKHND